MAKPVSSTGNTRRETTMTKKLKGLSSFAKLAHAYDRAPKAKTRIPHLLKSILSPKKHRKFKHSKTLTSKLYHPC